MCRDSNWCLSLVLALATVGGCAERSLQVDTDAGADSSLAAELGASDLALKPDSSVPTDVGGSGCQLNSDCPAGEFCDTPGCQGPGTCLTRPQSCPNPGGTALCGCDGNVYFSQCAAQFNGVSVANTGNCDQVQVYTDKNSYKMGETVTLTADNGTTTTIYLAGCTQFIPELFVGGTWDPRPYMLCAWEGTAQPLNGKQQKTTTLIASSPGTWRIRLDYGLGCDPNLPLNEENCASLHSALSTTYVVSPTTEYCDGLIKKYSGAVEQGQKCAMGPKALPCEKQVSSDLTCGCPTFIADDSQVKWYQSEWQAAGCSAAPCGIKCAQPAGGTCNAQGLCEDYYYK
jgi:hypothetical protein